MESISPNDLPKDFGKVAVCEDPLISLEKKCVPLNENVVCIKKTKKKPISAKNKKKNVAKKKQEDLWTDCREFSSKYKFISPRWVSKIVSSKNFNNIYIIKDIGDWIFYSHYFVFFVCTRNEFLGSKKLMIESAKKRKTVFNLMEKSLGKRLATTLCS